MVLIIGEKPSVSMSIAKIVGATNKKNGYIEGNGYLVSWCIGHLLNLANTEEYNPEFKKWKIEDLPIIPQEFKYKVSKGKDEQVAVLKELMNFHDVEYIVNACDSGREGELIFRLVYNYSKSNKPVKRLWISSMEDKAIADGLANLKDSSEYENLYQAALCRQQADWY